MKQFTYWGIIISFLFLWQFAPAQVLINKGEYFFDTDPGPGKATAISITTPADSVVLSLHLPTTGLSAGFHTLFIRLHYPKAKPDSNAMWGLYEGREFYIIPAGGVLNASEINSAEYFFDTDPGVGKGTSINTGALTDSSVLALNISVSSLSTGFHTLFIRYHYNNGAWGLYEGRTVYTFPVGAALNPAKISSAEYFFDTDPGVGKGTAISTGALTDSSVLALNISVSSLTSGFHALFIRYHYNNGLWGLYEGRTIYVIPPFNLNGATVSKAEYFFDTDPGVGKGTAVTIGTPSDSVNITEHIATNSLSAGFHTLFIRFQYNTGLWGLYEGRAFYVIPPNTLPNPALINSAEYFFDTDPGVGKGTSITVSPAADSVAQLLNNISVTGLSNGKHNLFIRYRYNNEIWGLYEGRQFTICNPPPANVTIAGDTTFCAGTDSVQLTANAGSTLTYQWERNGTNITGATSGNYTVLDSSGSYVVMVTDTGKCSAVSNPVIVTVTPSGTSSISISASATTICNGTKVTFSATATNGGSSPAYQWKVNGNNAGTNSSTFSDSTLSNNAVVTCALTPNGSCSTGSTSNSITMTVNPSGAASVSISANPGNVICSGTSVTFTADPVNGGTIPAYQWEVNGINAGTNSSSFTSSSLVSNDTVICVMTSNAACVTGSPAASNRIIISVGNDVIPGTITATKDTICENTNAKLTDSGSSGGNIQWQSSNTLDFTSIVGATDSTYTSGQLSQTTYYRVIVGTGSCADTSAPFRIEIVAAPVPSFNSNTNGEVVSFNASTSTGATSFYWTFGDDSSSTLENPVHTYDSVKTYHVCLTVDNSNNCTVTLCHNAVTYPTGINEITNDVNWQIYPDPFGSQLYINKGQTTDNIESIEVYDMLGRRLLLMAANDIMETPVKLDMTSLKSGVYCLRIKTNNAEYTKSVVKQQ